MSLKALRMVRCPGSGARRARGACPVALVSFFNLFVVMVHLS